MSHILTIYTYYYINLLDLGLLHKILKLVITIEQPKLALVYEFQRTWDTHCSLFQLAEGAKYPESLYIAIKFK